MTDFVFCFYEGFAVTDFVFCFYDTGKPERMALQLSADPDQILNGAAAIASR